jgi:hypothetical protein
MSMRDHRKLAVFHKAHQLALFVYREITPRLPRDERYGLVQQMRGCARRFRRTFLKVAGGTRIGISRISSVSRSAPPVRHIEDAKPKNQQPPHPKPDL